MVRYHLKCPRMAGKACLRAFYGKDVQEILAERLAQFFVNSP